MNFSGWKDYKIVDAIQFNPRETIKKGDKAKKIPMEKLEPYTRKITGFEETEFTSGTKFRNGDTLLARITPCLENGKTAQVDILSKNEVAFGSTEFIVLREKSGITDNNFIYYLSISPKFRNLAIKSMNGSSGRQRVQKDVLEQCQIKLPAIEEQKAIANILSVLDEKIETNNQINKKLEEMAQAIFKQWFVDFDFPNEEGKPYKSSGGEMFESELGMIPKGWRVIKLEDLCEIKTKSEKPFGNPERMYEHFSLPACDNGKLPVIESGRNISSNKYKIDNNCILISKLNPSTKRIWDPLCNTQNAVCSTEFIVFNPKDKNIKSFCYETINSDKFTEFLLKNVTGSTGSRQRVQPKNTLNYKLILPNKGIIQSFCSLIEPIHKKIKLTILQSDKLKNTRDLLLPKLMSGEIRVPLDN